MTKLNETMRLQLIKQYVKYREWIKKHQDQWGFVYTDRCDSLLFSALLGCATNDVILSAAQSNNGAWLRRPANYPECFKAGQSKSTISRDMLLGVAWYCHVNRRLDLSEQIIKYALRHALKMGQGTPSRVFMSLSLLSTFAWISYRLGGPSRPILRHLPSIWSKHVTGYQRHLSCLHMLLRKRLETGEDFTGYFNYYNNQTNYCHPLYLYAAGYSNLSTEYLLKSFPDYRLPDPLDTSGPWALENDSITSATLTHNNIEYSGADFIFMAGLLSEVI